MNTVKYDNNCNLSCYKSEYQAKLNKYILENGFIRNNIIYLFHSLDITRDLENYINKNNITLKELDEIINEIKNYMLSLSFEYPLINKYQINKKTNDIDTANPNLNIILKNNLSYIESYIEEKKKNLYIRAIDIIKHNNINELKDFIQKNDLSLGDLCTENYDILTYAIENNISQEIIDLIISHYCTLNYYFFEIEEGFEVEKSPLSSAIAEDNFKLADILIEHKADINFKLFFNDIIKNLTINKLLDDKNLKYILSKGFQIHYVNLESSFIYEMLKASYPSYFIEIVFKHFVYDNNFILDFLHFYKNKKTLSNKELYNLIKKEKSKISIKDHWYNTAVEYGAFDAIDIFIEYDIRKEDAIFNLIKNKKKMNFFK